DWTELPEEYRYQRLNNKVYLVNSNGEFEANPVELIYSEGKAYYKLMPEKTVVKENEFKAAEEVDLFDFQYTDQKQEMVVPVVVNEDIEKIDFSFDTKDNSFYGKKPKERMKDNLVALSLLKQLEKEQRLATIEEQKILAKYVGWGGLSEIFNPDNHSYAKEREELKCLITNEEYESARESVLTAYYTDPMIIEQIYDTVQRLGFKNGRILDPAMGTG
ncbi:helicase SNF2, partial [Enterococcus hirae]|nr:helicase SNF2 [Enterococcus hirae]